VTTRYAWWTRERVVEALRRYYRAHGTAPPGGPAWDRARRALGAGPRVYPSSASVRRHFPSLRRAWIAAGVALGHGRDAWRPEDDAFLAAHWGRRPDAWVAARLGRTPQTCHLRATRHLGQTRRDALLTARDLGRLFGVDPTTAVRAWLPRGWVAAAKSSVGAGPRTTAWAFDPESVERFVRERPWAYDWRTTDPAHPLGRLAREVNEADPWLTLPEAMARYGFGTTFAKTWTRRGLLPSRRRPVYGRGGARAGRLVFRERDLPGALAAIEAAVAENRSAAAHRRVERGGGVRQWASAVIGPRPWEAAPGDPARWVRPAVPLNARRGAGAAHLGRTGRIERVYWTYRHRPRGAPRTAPAPQFWAAVVAFPSRRAATGLVRHALPLDCLVWCGGEEGDPRGPEAGPEPAPRAHQHPTARTTRAKGPPMTPTADPPAARKERP
jgi:hypothetical protein